MNERIKLIRKYFNLSQEKFGNRIKIGKSAVCKLESGENNPTERTIALICSEFDISSEWLVDGVGDMFEKKDKESELIDFANKIASFPNDSIQKRFVYALSKLDESEWNTIKKIVDKILEE